MNTVFTTHRNVRLGKASLHQQALQKRRGESNRVRSVAWSLGIHIQIRVEKCLCLSRMKPATSPHFPSCCSNHFQSDNLPPSLNLTDLKLYE